VTTIPHDNTSQFNDIAETNNFTLHGWSTITSNKYNIADGCQLKNQHDIITPCRVTCIMSLHFQETW